MPWAEALDLAERSVAAADVGIPNAFGRGRGKGKGKGKGRGKSKGGAKGKPSGKRPRAGK